METEGYVHGTPAITGDLTTVSGCDGFLWLVRLEDGTVETKIELGGHTGASPAIVGNRAFVGTFENQVLGVDLDARAVALELRAPGAQVPVLCVARRATTGWS